MTVIEARQIAVNIIRLAELVARFQAKYGRNYVMSLDCTEDAYRLYEDILEQQATIAELLHPQALDIAYNRFGEWWTRHDVIDSAIVNEMAMDACNLVNRAGYMEENGQTESHTLLPIEKSIARLLSAKRGQVWPRPLGDGSAICSSNGK